MQRCKDLFCNDRYLHNPYESSKKVFPFTSFLDKLINIPQRVSKSNYKLSYLHLPGMIPFLTET